MNTDKSSNEAQGNSINPLLTAGAYEKFRVLVRRNYYGEIQEEIRTIEGENFKRAKFEFNNRHIDWSVVCACS